MKENPYGVLITLSLCFYFYEKETPTGYSLSVFNTP